MYEGALIELDLAGRLLGAGKQAADHDRVRAGGNGLGDIAGVADAAVGDQGHAAGGKCLGDVRHRGDLRHADAGDDARGADRTRADADLDAIGARGDQVERPFAGDDISGDDLQIAPACLDFGHHLEHAARSGRARCRRR